MELDKVCLVCKITYFIDTIFFSQLKDLLHNEVLAMAPDISQLPSSGYSAPNETASEYRIPDITFKDPANRKVKVLTIGAGVSGILMAYQIQKQCQK